MYPENTEKNCPTSYLDNIHRAAASIKNADRLLIGIGSGMSTFEGLDYADPKLAARWYPEYYGIGLESILDIQASYWNIETSKPENYWGFWAKHIFHIRYETEIMKPYMDLYGIIKGKNYFICSTNVDGQLEKAEFPKDRVFTPQGNFSMFQCQKPCCQEVYYNKEMIDAMLSHMTSPVCIRTEDIPHCCHCGSLLIPNLRNDERFVEKPHIQNAKQYEEFINESRKEKLVLLEIGVGFTTPKIIRYPFEKITQEYPFAKLIRINKEKVSTTNNFANKVIVINEDIVKSLDDIRRTLFKST